MPDRPGALGGRGWGAPASLRARETYVQLLTLTVPEKRETPLLGMIWDRGEAGWRLRKCDLGLLRVLDRDVHSWFEAIEAQLAAAAAIDEHLSAYIPDVRAMAPSRIYTAQRRLPGPGEREPAYTVTVEDEEEP